MNRKNEVAKLTEYLFLLFMKFYFMIILITIIFVSCNGGLAPTEPGLENKTGFGGTITFVGDWDPEITQTNIVLFKNPLLSESDFNIQNLRYLSTAIPFGTTKYNYNTIDSVSFGNVEAGEYAYLAVVQTKADPITLDRKDWFVIGVYQSERNEPGKISVEENKFEYDVNIVCDFNNPPPQPPGGE